MVKPPFQCGSSPSKWRRPYTAAPKLPYFRHSHNACLCRSVAKSRPKCMDLPPSKIEWHLVRDGKPYGPLSDLEFFKFIELGHLEPNDLLWRDGFKGWQSANVYFQSYRNCRAHLTWSQRSFLANSTNLSSVIGRWNANLRHEKPV